MGKEEKRKHKPGKRDEQLKKKDTSRNSIKNNSNIIIL